MPIIYGSYMSCYHKKKKKVSSHALIQCKQNVVCIHESVYIACSVYMCSAAVLRMHSLLWAALPLCRLDPAFLCSWLHSRFLLVQTNKIHFTPFSFLSFNGPVPNKPTTHCSAVSFSSLRFLAAPSIAFFSSSSFAARASNSCTK